MPRTKHEFLSLRTAQVKALLRAGLLLRVPGGGEQKHEPNGS